MIPVKNYIDRIDKSLERIRKLPINKRSDTKLKLAKDFFDELKKELTSKSVDGYDGYIHGCSIEQQISIWESVISAIDS